MIKKNIKKVTLFVFAALFLFSCSSDSSNKAFESAAPEYDLNENTGGKGEGESKQAKGEDRKIIKEGAITFETDNIASTKQLITNVTTKLNGYVANENIYTYTNKQEYRLVIRIPADKFEELLAKISDNATKIDSKNVDVLDVTEEYIDIESRIKTKKELESRYKEILKQANKVEEILSIEKEIGQLRTEIEATEGRMRYLKDRIGFSTLTVNFYQKINSAFGFSLKFTQGIKNGWTNLLWFLVGLVNIWPFILLTTLAIYFLRRIIKKKKSKKAE
jgi:hypothetical protein